MSEPDQSNGSASLPAPLPVGAIDDATVISRGESAASWSGTATGPIAGGPATTGEIGRVLHGTMLGPYRLDEFIGGGGMGAVFRALDTTLDRTVAVKVLAGRQADDEEMLKRFRNEAQSAARLDHENIGRVHAVGSENGWHFIVFEFIEGTNLRDVIRTEGPFDLARTVDVAIQVADALEHASERDVVHRDIKPSNIMITPSGRARIVDMGLARLPHLADDRDLTVSGMTLGTFDYISPEQARDPRAADVRSDLYSLGCTIFFMLTGRPPFADGTMVQKLLQHQQQAPPALDEIRPDVPRRFAEIVTRLMAKDPLDRYQRPAVLVADLAAFADDQGLHIASPPRPLATAVVPAKSIGVGSLPWLVPVAGLLAMVAAMWAVSAWDRRATVTAPLVHEGDASASLITVVTGSPEPGEVASLAEAVRRVADGGTIELAYDGVRREEAFGIAGRYITIRPALGRRPVVEFSGMRASTPEGSPVACDVGDGTLVVRGVSLRLAGATDTAARPVLFGIRSGRLTCDDVTLAMPGNPVTPGPVAGELPAFVTVASDPGVPSSSTIVLDRTRAAGDAVFLDAHAAGAGRVTLRWHDGALVSPRWLVFAQGTRAEPLDIACDLDRVEVACGAGVVSLGDSAEWPVPVRLRVRAVDSRIIVDAGRPFIEQHGNADIDAYRTACQWIDRRSRYEGGGAFRRIEASTERIDEPVRDVVPPLFHQQLPGSRPDPASWAGSGG
ncbi:MAG: serine/threonine protein kinase [Planctomycetes bacterium]|nr:serine/threonine protein kinase [Planctomycetota bacterium]